jgi:hypothetical protein
MIDERPADQEAIWQRVRGLEPPPGAKQRVNDAVLARARRSPARYAWLAIPAAAIAAAVVWLVVQPGGDAAPAGPLVVAASGAQQGTTRVAAGDRLADGAVRVDGSLRLALDRASVDVVGPALFEVSRQAVVLREGQVRIEGSAEVAGPACKATIRGTSTVEVKPATMLVTVIAGSAEIAPPDLSCSVVDLSVNRPETATAPTPRPPEPPAGPAPVAVAPPPEPAPKRVADPRSDLALQSEAYFAAQRVRATDPAGALAKLRAIVRRWPRAAIRHEVDLGIIDILVELGRTDEARRAARRFLADHPRSERAGEIREIAGDADD